VNNAERRSADDSKISAGGTGRVALLCEEGLQGKLFCCVISQLGAENRMSPLALLWLLFF